jgi:hypothetical protein
MASLIERFGKPKQYKARSDPKIMLGQDKIHQESAILALVDKIKKNNAISQNFHNTKPGFKTM